MSNRHRTPQKPKRTITKFSSPGEERVSTMVLPNDMSERHFGRMANVLVSAFTSGRFMITQLLGDGAAHIGDTLPLPAGICIKGSSITGVSYDKRKEQKQFGPHSDYDVAMVWPEALAASDHLAFFIQDTLDLLRSTQPTLTPRLTDLSNQLDLAISKISPRSSNTGNPEKTYMLKLHNSDRLNFEERSDGSIRLIPGIAPHLLYPFPTGEDHWQYCQQLQDDMRQIHDINFVIIMSMDQMHAREFPVQLDLTAPGVEQARVCAQPHVNAAVTEVRRISSMQSDRVAAMVCMPADRDDLQQRAALRGIGVEPIPVDGTMGWYSWSLLVAAAEAHERRELSTTPEKGQASMHHTGGGAKMTKKQRKAAARARRQAREAARRASANTKISRELFTFGDPTDYSMGASGMGGGGGAAADVSEVPADMGAGGGGGGGAAADMKAAATAAQDGLHRMVPFLREAICEILAFIVAEIDRASEYITNAIRVHMQIQTDVRNLATEHEGAPDMESIQNMVQPKMAKLREQKPSILKKNHFKHVLTYIHKVKLHQPNPSSTAIMKLVNTLEGKYRKLLSDPRYQSFFDLEKATAEALARRVSPVSVFSGPQSTDDYCESPQPQPRKGRSRSRLQSGTHG